MCDSMKEKEFILKWIKGKVKKIWKTEQSGTEKRKD